VAAFQIIRPELVRGAGKEMLKAGLIGCGGRGQQAVMDMMNGTENTQIVAMGDVFEDRLEGALARAIADEAIGRAHVGVVGVDRDATELVRAVREQRWRGGVLRFRVLGGHAVLSSLG